MLTVYGTGTAPAALHLISMKYPKLAAAIDEMLAKNVREYGQDFVEMLLATANVEPPPVEPKKEPEKDV